TNFNVEGLITEMGMSHSVFYRKIKSLTGQSVVHFIRDIRLKKAAQLLQESSLRISEIALEVGIEDPKYFGKIFTQVFHVSPTQYAKNNSLWNKEKS
ncbi:MAG: helix-turn-helix domain-containing protein, partial [Maribacter sp.]